MEKRLPALVAAMDVDLDDDGWPKSRKPLAEVYDWTALGMEASRVFSALGVFLAYGEKDDAYGIYQIDLDTGTSTLVVGGFSSDGTETVELFEFEGEIYWTSPLRTGRITVASGTATANVWGVEAPDLEALSSMENPNSALPYGEYLFAVTEVVNGIESGASSVAKATFGISSFVGSGGALNTPYSSVELTITSNNNSGGYFRVYMSRIGGGQLYYAFATDKTSIKVPGDPTLSTFQLKTSSMRGPIPGYGIFAYRKTLCTYRGRWVYPDAGVSHHLFNPASFVIFVPYPVCAAQGVAGGAWIATEQGMYWLFGESRATMTIIRMDNDTYAKGSLLVPASYVPVVQAQGMIALFVNTESVVAGLEDGRLIKLTQNKYKPDDVTGKRVSITIDKSDTNKKIIINATAAGEETEEFAHGRNEVQMTALLGLMQANASVSDRTSAFSDMANGPIVWFDSTSETEGR
jgi:hypothetical protein